LFIATGSPFIGGMTRFISGELEYISGFSILSAKTSHLSALNFKITHPDFLLLFEPRYFFTKTRFPAPHFLLILFYRRKCTIFSAGDFLYPGHYF